MVIDQFVAIVLQFEVVPLGDHLGGDSDREQPADDDAELVARLDATVADEGHGLFLSWRRLRLSSAFSGRQSSRCGTPE